MTVMPSNVWVHITESFLTTVLSVCAHTHWKNISKTMRKSSLDIPSKPLHDETLVREFNGVIFMILFFILILFLPFMTAKLHDNTKQALGKNNKVVAEGESLKIVSEFGCKYGFMSRRKSPCGFWIASVE